MIKTNKTIFEWIICWRQIKVDSMISSKSIDIIKYFGESLNISQRSL